MNAKQTESESICLHQALLILLDLLKKIN